MTAQALTICVAEIGGTSIKIGFAHDGVVASYARTFPTGRLQTGSPVRELAAIIREAGEQAQLKPQHVVATVPGFIGKDQDTVLNTANIPALKGVPLASSLSAELSIPVALERDTVLQLLGEHAAGAVQGMSGVLAVYIGTGIGAAYLDRSGIFRGGGWALEIGHMPVYRPDLCPQPDRIEAFASGRALADMALRHDRTVADLFHAEAPANIRDAIDSIVWQQASAVASAVAICSPEVLLLGGGVVEIPDYPRDLLAQRIVDCLPIINDVQALDIRWTRLGWQAAVHGALSGHLRAMSSAT